MSKVSELTLLQGRYASGIQTHEKMLNIVSQGNYELNQQWGMSTYVIEWLKPKTMTTANNGKYVE